MYFTFCVLHSFLRALLFRSFHLKAFDDAAAAAVLSFRLTCTLHKPLTATHTDMHSIESIQYMVRFFLSRFCTLSSIRLSCSRLLLHSQKSRSVALTRARSSSFLHQLKSDWYNARDENVQCCYFHFGLLLCAHTTVPMCFNSNKEKKDIVHTFAHALKPIIQKLHLFAWVNWGYSLFHSMCVLLLSLSLVCLLLLRQLSLNSFRFSF